jgi:protein-disulfide isomerase
MADEKKSPLLLIGGIAAVVIAAAAWFFTQGGGAPNQTAATAVDTSAGETVAAGEPLPDFFLGEADAPIEVIEYASFTCPHCASFHMNIYPQLKADYIDTGKVKFVMREVYFDQFGLAAGLLARCGGDMRYFGIVDLLFEKQSEWARGDGEAVVQNLYRIGRQAGLENDQMQACLQDRELSTALVEDFRLKAGQDDVNATPSFVINGQKFANSSWSDLKSTLDGFLN